MSKHTDTICEFAGYDGPPPVKIILEMQAGRKLIYGACPRQALCAASAYLEILLEPLYDHPESIILPEACISEFALREIIYYILHCSPLTPTRGNKEYLPKLDTLEQMFEVLSGLRLFRMKPGFDRHLTLKRSILREIEGMLNSSREEVNDPNKSLRSKCASRDKHDETTDLSFWCKQIAYLERCLSRLVDEARADEEVGCLDFYLEMWRMDGLTERVEQLTGRNLKPKSEVFNAEDARIAEISSEVMLDIE